MKQWKTGDVITANDMNNLETRVYLIGLDYDDETMRYTMQATAKEIFDIVETGAIVTLYWNGDVAIYGTILSASCSNYDEMANYVFEARFDGARFFTASSDNENPTSGDK